MPLPYDPNDSIPDQIKASFKKSLSNLKTSYLDSYILHSPMDDLETTLSAWEVLVDLQDQGKVHKIGVSNTYDVETLERLGMEREVQIVQNRWHEGNHWDPAVFRYCKRKGIEYQCVRLFNLFRCCLKYMGVGVFGLCPETLAF